MGNVYDKNEIINDYLTHDLNQSQLARFYDEKYYEGFISSQTISKILNNKNLPDNIKNKIQAKKEKLKQPKTILQKSEYIKLLKKIDSELYKLVINKVLITEEHIMKFRVAYLYISGYSYKEISSLLGIAQGSVSNYLNSALMLNCLNAETRYLLESKLKNNDKFYHDSLGEKVKEAVDNFILTGADYQMTMEMCHISARTLSRYLNEDVVRSFVDDDTYFTFCKLVKEYNTKRSSIAATSSSHLNKIKQTLSKDSSDLSSILKLVLIDNVKDIDKICSKLNLRHRVVINYLNNHQLIKDTFGDYVYNEYLNIYGDILHLYEENKKISIIDYYLRSRASIEDLNNIFHEYFTSIKKILSPPSNYIKNYLGDDIETKVEMHALEVKKIRQKCPRNMFVISSPEMIDVAKEDLIYVNGDDYKLLEYVAALFAHGGDILEFSKNYNIPYNFALNCFLIRSLKDILNEQANQRLAKYIKYDHILTGANGFIQFKKKFIIDVIQTFFDNLYNVEQTLTDLDIPFQVLKRVVNDNMSLTIYISDMIKKMREEVNKYEKLINEIEKGKTMNQGYRIKKNG